MKRIYKSKELTRKFFWLHKYYSKNLWKPAIYAPKVFRIQSRFYFCHEWLLKGKNIYYISEDEENSDTGSSSLISNNNNILEKFRNQIEIYKDIKEHKEISYGKTLVDCDISYIELVPRKK